MCKGRQATLPAKDAPSPGGGDIALGYFDNDLPASVSQGGTSTVFTLDVAKRRLVQSSTTAGQTTTTTRHYTDGSDNPSWIDVTSPAGAVSTTRFVSSISGSLGAAITSDGVTRLELSNIHGDIVTTVVIAAAAPSEAPTTGITGWAAYTEYGTPVDPVQAKSVGSAAGYGWLGGKERSTTDGTAQLTLMGARFYNRATGAFTSTDPVPGGNLTAYSYPIDPINMYDLDGREGTSAMRKRIARAFLYVLDAVSWSPSGWLASARLGLGIRTAIRATGGRCEVMSGLQVCQGGRFANSIGRNGGTTYGDTFVLPQKGSLKSTRRNRSLIEHEKAHVAQYRRVGPFVFGARYALAAALSYFVTGSYACANIYENAAGLKEGGYGKECNVN